MWCVSPPIQISQISQIPQISFEVFHGIPRKIIHCKLPKPAKPPTKYMQRELRKAQQLPQLAEEQQRRSPTFQDATRCDRKHKYMDYIMDYIYIYLWYLLLFIIFYLCLRFLAYCPNGRIALSVPSEDTICIICICAGQQHFSSPNLVQQRKLSTLAVKSKVFNVLATVFRTLWVHEQSHAKRT
jgi:hypothetical protein